MPEILITAPTLLIATLYIIFAMATSYLAFEINPLSRHPRAQSTGRVEATFQAYKISVLLLYLARFVTPITISAIHFLFSLYVLRKHVTVMPFHNNTTNKVRGGIYGLVVWWSFASLGMSVIHVATSGSQPEWLQGLQWVCIGVSLLPNTPCAQDEIH